MNVRITAVTVLLLSLGLSSPLSAQEAEDVGTEIVVDMNNGDRFTGRLLESTAGYIVIDHGELGNITLQRAAFKPKQTEEEVAEAEVSSPWSGTFDISASGKRGNSQDQGARVDITARHEDDVAVDQYAFLYEKARSESQVPKAGGGTKKSGKPTVRRAYLEARREWFLDDSVWRPYLQGSVDDDKFKAYDQRLRVIAGGAYPWIENDKERWVGRVGVGTAKDTGVPGAKWSREAQLGMDYFNQLSADRSIALSSDVYPGLETRGGFVFVTKAEYRMVLEAEDPWTVKLGMEHTRDTDPATDSTGAQDGKNDLAYYLSAGFVF